ncbi:MAG TPA: OmpA family protein, partial [Flavobacteriales bacterium]
EGAVNGPYHEGPMAFSADGRTMYFSRSNYYGRKLLKDGADVSHLKLFRATLDEAGEWNDIREFAYNSEEWSVGHPALSTDGRTLYFASDMPGGQGGTDLWRCVDNGQGWGRPENLGATINTPGNEMFPTVNGDALYFSSNAHENMGGLDIFETHPESGYWSEPANMMYPINTEHDDFGMVLDTGGVSGFFSSDRNGKDRVFGFTMHEPEFVLEGVVMNPIDGMYLPNIEVELVAESGGIQRTTTAEGGTFRFDLQPNRMYTLKASMNGMLTSSVPVSTMGITSNAVLREKLELQPMQLEKPIVEVNVLFDFNKWDIRPDAAAELNKLAKIIADNPGFLFELSAHTDSRGGDTYNLVLSDARAKSAVDHLMRQGVGPDQLRAMGYGETRLVNECGNGVKCTEEAHQANRRLEFKVVALRETAAQP